MKKRYKIEGMSCSACSSAVQKSVSKESGVLHAEVNLLTERMSVEYDESQITDDAIVAAVVKAGYGASVEDSTGEVSPATEQPQARSSAVQNDVSSARFRLILSFSFLLPLMYLAMHHMMKMWIGLPVPGFIVDFFHGPENGIAYTFTQFLLLLPILYVNRKFFQVGFRTLLHRAPNMDSLIAIGSSAAVIYGVYVIFRIGFLLGRGDLMSVEPLLDNIYFESAGTILTLITLGKFLEERSKRRTSDAINKLISLSPETAILVSGKEEKEVPVSQIVPGDILAVRPGTRVPVDGVIVEGSGAIDQSAITGESLPVEKMPGDSVVTASVNQNGFFLMRAVKVGEDTTLAQIIRLMDEASSSKAPIARLADKVSGVFVPIVIAIAVITAVVWILLGQSAEFALTAAVSVLVISCPCALGLATPVAIMVGTGKGAAAGILVKSAEALEKLSGVDTVVVDKTGTLTEGSPRITFLQAAEGLTNHELLRIAASLEKYSEHPLALAVLTKAQEEGVIPEKVTHFAVTPGIGLEAVLDGQRYIAGSFANAESRGLIDTTWRRIAEDLSDEGKSILCFDDTKRILGIAGVEDPIRETSYEAIRILREKKISVMMLTGDNKRTAEAIRKRLGIDYVRAEVLPQDKDEEIRLLRKAGHVVAMVGDGINDAPALARADVGIAIGSGTDIAIESADIVLMQSDVRIVADAIELSRAVLRNIRQNLFWAFFYNVIGIPLAAGILFPLTGLLLNPMFAAAAMSISSIFVVTNALRLRRFRASRHKKG